MTIIKYCFSPQSCSIVALAEVHVHGGNNNYEVNLLKVKTDLCVLFVNRLFSVFESKLDLILPVCSAFPFRSTSATVGCSDVHNPELVHRQIWKCKTLKVHHRNLILVSQSESREYFWTTVGNREHKHLNNSAQQIQELGPSDFQQCPIDTSEIW